MWARRSLPIPTCAYKHACLGRAVGRFAQHLPLHSPQAPARRADGLHEAWLAWQGVPCVRHQRYKSTLRHALSESTPAAAPHCTAAHHGAIPDQVRGTGLFRQHRGCIPLSDGR